MANLPFMGITWPVDLRPFGRFPGVLPCAEVIGIYLLMLGPGVLHAPPGRFAGGISTASRARNRGHGKRERQIRPRTTSACFHVCLVGIHRGFSFISNSLWTSLRVALLKRG